MIRLAPLPTVQARLDAAEHLAFLTTEQCREALQILSQFTISVIPLGPSLVPEQWSSGEGLDLLPEICKSSLAGSIHRGRVDTKL